MSKQSEHKLSPAARPQESSLLLQSLTIQAAATGPETLAGCNDGVGQLNNLTYRRQFPFHQPHHAHINPDAGQDIPPARCKLAHQPVIGWTLTANSPTSRRIDRRSYPPLSISDLRHTSVESLASEPGSTWQAGRGVLALRAIEFPETECHYLIRTVPDPSTWLDKQCAGYYGEQKKPGLLRGSDLRREKSKEECVCRSCVSP